MAAGAAELPPRGGRSDRVPPTLYQHEGAWGLVSIDQECMASQALLQFAGITYNVDNCNNDALSPSGKLPVLRRADDNKPLITGAAGVAEYLAQKGFSLGRLSNEQRTSMRAVISLVRQRLYAATARLEVREAVFNAGRARSMDAVMNDADNAYKCLKLLLRDQDFFFGDSPCELDAYAFGHLAFVLDADLADSRLRLLLGKHEKLVAYVHRILERYCRACGPGWGGGSAQGRGSLPRWFASMRRAPRARASRGTRGRRV